MRMFLFALPLMFLPFCAHAQEAEPKEENDPAFLNQRGTKHFFAGRIKESLQDWDRVVKLVPNQAPHHWQRGISLYYADRYEDGVAQFESHQTVNGRDVENAVWHFLCAVRAKGGSVKKAREKIYPFAGDSRVPLKEVHALFKGTGKPEAVLAAAKEQSDPGNLRNHLCYAHLYLGLYFEALGNKKKSAGHMKKAAVDYKMDHYMGRVAQIHFKLRSAAKPGARKLKGNEKAFGKFILIDDVHTDGGDRTVAKKNAANDLIKHPDIDAMIGIWAYNAPMCLEALKDADKLKEVKVFAFDEDPKVLAAIKAGTCEGSIVQDPYQFGYQAMAHLRKLALASDRARPTNPIISIPTRTITTESVDKFIAENASHHAILKAELDNPAKQSGPKLAFVTNVADPWWSHAQAGCITAARDLGISVKFIMNSTADVPGQHRILEGLVNEGDIAGIAVSVLDPDQQTAAVNKIASSIPLITVDSDAPKSKRLLYLGTDSYAGGRRMGKLIKASLPEGGRIMLYVGMTNQLNSIKRRDGILDELKAK